jgi:hypothetical protein
MMWLVNLINEFFIDWIFVLTGLFNLRGGDIPYNPVFLSFAIVSLDSTKLVQFLLINF